MAAITVSDLTLMANEPCVSDRKLSDALGFERPTRVRELVARHRDEMVSHGDVFHRSLRRNPTNLSASDGLPQADAKPSSRGGRPVVEYYLNEAQALLVCMFARTEKAAAVRKQVIEVFLAWRRGELVSAAAVPDRTVEILQRLEARLNALESTGRQMQSVADDPVPTVLALTHASELWNTGRRPAWWHDLDVRHIALTSLRQMSLDQAIALIVEKLGADRAPSRSSLHRFWQRLDRLKATNPSLRTH
ncbi:hypothetical protein [Caulobacter henricii]|uniref:Uncharacterized protein n=1 Tax=Caulobacter henricii TaxID=69395 RepID=A0A0P0P1Y9_9CAUL|nr:hypothetical protein [Caulobacter henricii]ALL14296.1 hypothetical protein AQ619_13600 [Caulobacter henricii]